MTKNIRTLRKLEAQYQAVARVHGSCSAIAVSVDDSIAWYCTYLDDKYRINRKPNHTPPASKPNRYTLSNASSSQLSTRQRKKLTRFKQARVCLTTNGLSVVLDSNAIFQ